MAGYALEPGAGPAYGFHGSAVVIKASGSDTAGQLSVLESAYPAGLSVHGHIHVDEDEMFYVLAGEISGFCEGSTWTATAGSFVFVPRNHLHGFTVTGQGTARALVITGPAQLDSQIIARAESPPAIPD